MPWESVSRTELLWAAALFVGSIVATSLVAGALLVGMPADHFVGDERAVLHKVKSPALRAALAVGKNLLGAVLVVMGVVLSLPGVPGQGVLTIFVGIALLDIPGKRRLELRFVRRPRVRGAIDRLRARFGKAPLELPEPDADVN